MQTQMDGIVTDSGDDGDEFEDDNDVSMHDVAEAFCEPLLRRNNESAIIHCISSIPRGLNYEWDKLSEA